MKIYKVYKNEIYFTKVVKETKKYYWISNNSSVFGFVSRIAKGCACLTPQQAIDRALNSSRGKETRLKDRLMTLEEDLLTLEGLTTLSPPLIPREGT